MFQMLFYLSTARALESKPKLVQVREQLDEKERANNYGCVEHGRVNIETLDCRFQFVNGSARHVCPVSDGLDFHVQFPFRLII